MEDNCKQSGRKERLWGEIGTIIMQFMPFCTTGPPADNEYAVEPVGVAIKTPSPPVSVNN